MVYLTNLLAADWVKSVLGVLLAIVILLAMVTIHEFGHYIAGKLLGFKINEFSVGFGPALFKKRSKKSGELFALRIIPLGGYCAFDGEDEYDDEGREQEPAPETEKQDGEDEYPEPKGERFNDQPPWKRIIVLVAGATMNYLLALLLLIIMFVGIGRPVYSVVVEKPEETAAVAVQTQTDGIGLQTGDIILQVNGKNVYLITDYLDALNGEKAGAEIPVLVLSEGEEVTRTLVLAADADFKNMSDTQTLLKSMNIYGLYTVTWRQGFFPSIGHSLAYSVKIGGTVLRSLGELLTGKLGLSAMGGPVTTISVTAEAAASGLMSFLNIAAFIGVNLAVFNLLPVPALDGCKVIFCIIEWIRKKPVNRKVETIIHFVGLVFLFGFAILVDLLQLFI
ncbi:MAG: site-2 protease family protein [Clostridia bacterium]|nr:site-2 protease family protein [Clostridia bacterium]